MKTLQNVAALVLLSLCSLTALASPVDINTADAATLAQEIRGIGPKLAALIVQYRKEHGPFESIDELQQVKGIGPKVLERNQENLVIDGGQEAPTTSE